jgi:hypothetical protein
MNEALEELEDIAHFEDFERSARPWNVQLYLYQLDGSSSTAPKHFKTFQNLSKCAVTGGRNMVGCVSGCSRHVRKRPTQTYGEFPSLIALITNFLPSGATS